VVIEVADTGSGMLPRVRERIFEPFFSTKKAGEGTGLGLSVSADIVSGFGGSIEVASENGEGSRFFVVLPRHAEGWHGPEKAATTRPPMALARKRVLLVDDEPQVLTALERSLRSVHDVTIAASGREAISLLERDAQFDVVLCDLTMPDVDGVAVFADIQARFPHLASRFVAVTGGAITERAAVFTETSGTRVVSKPMSPDLLLRTIDAVTR
jgi:CheY-like chemotaxis protein